MEHFIIIINGWKPLTYITKSSILDVAVVLDPSLGKSDVTILYVANVVILCYIDFSYFKIKRNCLNRATRNVLGSRKMHL